jgi:alanine racemase
VLTIRWVDGVACPVAGRISMDLVTRRAIAIPEARRARLEALMLRLA